MTKKTILLIASVFVINSLVAGVDSIGVFQILKTAEVEMRSTRSHYNQKVTLLYQQLELIEHDINKIKAKRKKKVLLKFKEKFELEDSIRNTYSELELNLLKIRYRKGIELIKIVYEKTLGLDHHFAGMQTFNNITALSNPHSYPGFQKVKNVIDKKANKRYNMSMPLLFESNPYLSATSILISTLLSNNKKADKEKELEKISCILDFTVRMNADLNLIRHETEYLNNANREILEKCEVLFGDYTKVIGYHKSLKDCRNEDDWETVFELLDKEIKELEAKSKDPKSLDSFIKKEINLEFATQRVSVFLNQYTDFISLGKQYYQKFDNIVSTYENEDICQEKLPRQFTELKYDIKSTIDKFTNTYDLPELQGSKLKNLLFGDIQ